MIGTEDGVAGLAGPCENDPGWHNAQNELAGAKLEENGMAILARTTPQLQHHRNPVFAQPC